MIPELKDLLNKFGNRELIFLNNLPVVAYVDEVRFKNKELTVLVFLDTKIEDYLNVQIIFRTEYMQIKELVHHRYLDNKYHHTELLLFKPMEILTIRPDNLLIYKNNLSIEDCKLNNDEDLLYILNNYNLTLIKDSEIIEDNNIIESPITHIIAIPFKYNITIANILRIKDDYYEIRSIENLDERNEYLILKCAKFKDNERI